MSVIYFMFLLDDCAENAIVNALLCIADALWAKVLGNF